MIVLVTEQAVSQESVVVFTGTVPASPITAERPVSFGVDWRAANDLNAALAEEGEIYCEVEPWQIIGPW